MALRKTLLLTALCATLSMSTAGTQTIEDAERELAAARAEQVRRDEAARKERERQQAVAAATERKNREAAAAAAAARSASLVLRSDAACKLSINAEDSGAIGPGETRKLEVTAGEVLLECISSEDPTLKYSEVKRFEAQQNSVVLIELQAKLDVAARQRDAKAAAALDPRHPNRFIQTSDGLLQDTRTGLYWTQSDNSSDINWNDARQYCASKGLALPSVDELAALYDTGTGTPCGAYTCKVSNLFRLTSPFGFYWSGTANGSAEAWNVDLFNGARFSQIVAGAINCRALCVRRS